MQFLYLCAAEVSVIAVTSESFAAMGTRMKSAQQRCTSKYAL